MSLRYSSLFRNDPFFYDPFSSFTTSLFDPFFTDTPMLMSTSNNNNNSNNNQQQLQQSSSNTNNNNTDTRVGTQNNKSRRLPGTLSLFSPLIATRNVPMPDMKVDMFTTPTAYDIHAHCSGIDKNDINITIEDRVLNIQAERKQITKKLSSGKSSSPAQITEEKTHDKNNTKTNNDNHMEEEKNASPSNTNNTSSTKSGSNNNSSTTTVNTTSNKSNADMNDDADMGHYDYIENVYGQVQRSFTLPEDADPSGLNAKYEDGVISIHIPRIPQQKPQKQKITLQ